MLHLNFTILLYTQSCETHINIHSLAFNIMKSSLATEREVLSNSNVAQSSTIRSILNKVPEITVFFWIIKVLCTTVGETAADFLNVNLNLGLTGVSVVTGILLVIVLFFQFRARKYIPSIYWLAVVLISVFGTLVTDNLTDKLGVPLEASTVFFTVLLALTFVFWFIKEKTLSIHSIFTRQREFFYWLAILFTFALGTASGDLMAEGLALGYPLTGVIIAGIILVVASAWRLGLNPILSFWMIYIMTRPLGASLGDYLSQPQKYGGLNWGATMTSVVFLGAILSVVTYLSITKRDVIPKTVQEDATMPPRTIFVQVAVTAFVVLLVSGFGYHFRQVSLQGDASTDVLTNNPTTLSATGTTTSGSTPQHTTTTSKIGDLSNFKIITQDTLSLVQAGKLADATTRIADFEHDWDIEASRLKRLDGVKWTEIDTATDLTLRQLRSTNPNAAACETALKALLATLQ